MRINSIEFNIISALHLCSDPVSVNFLLIHTFSLVPFEVEINSDEKTMKNLKGYL